MRSGLTASATLPRLVTEVAEQAGHSVEVLLRVYAKCLDDGQALANARIEAALKLGR